MSDPALYTVGWICAIATEYTAARQFLDEVHDCSGCCLTANDTNEYTLGKMAGHNVVIAVLPDGEYGLSSAASVAKDMLNNFSNVRVGLMVGIGGGAPTVEHDIRLGDVVVSSPSTGKGGVYQYDYGKLFQGQGFQQTGFLNQPPRVLRGAVSGLRSMYEEDGHQIEERIEALLDKKPRMRKRYGRPSPVTDRLYESKVVHPPNVQGDCGKLCGSQASDIVQRCENEDREDSLAIHYGTIASANQLMKDATTRDAIAKEHGILCFEMEAAGLMNHFPCLVVRGICDYSDSHKNKRWQGYAAMTAAAYAKDILVKITPRGVEREKKIVDVLASMEQNICREINETTVVVNELRMSAKDREIGSWLSPPDPSTNFHEALDRRHEGTGQWFIKSTIFEFFSTAQMSYLWLSGIAGCGKTVLSASIIENLQQSTLSPPAVLLYFYFNFNDVRKQTLNGLLRSLLWQLNSSPSGSEYLHASYGDRKAQLSNQKLAEMLETILPVIGRVIVYIDALDECAERPALLQWLTRFAAKNTSNLQIITTSRKEYDIEVALGKWMAPNAMISIQHSQVDEDIRAYVRARILSDQGLERWKDKPNVQADIEKHLMDRAQGMFRWAKCQLDSLVDCISLRQLKQALSTLPTTLDETYARMLDQIPSTSLEDATKLLQVLTWSERPLFVEEAVDFIAVNLDSKPSFSVENRLPIPKEIVKLCSGLVTLVQVGEYPAEVYRSTNHDIYRHIKPQEEIRLAHFSVKEYLTSDRLRRDGYRSGLYHPEAASYIASVSLTYLLQIPTEIDRGDMLVKGAIISAFPLALYSARYWLHFARIANFEDLRLQLLIDQLLLVPERCARWLHFFDPESPNALVPGPPSVLPQPLYYASIGGLKRVASRLIEGGADIDCEGARYDNALQFAVAHNYKNMVMHLMEQGANINAYRRVSALQTASRKGLVRMVRLLLDNGAQVNARAVDVSRFQINRDRESVSPLQAACLQGHLTVVQLLLDNGADVNLVGGAHGSALQAACISGRSIFDHKLLGHSAEANVRSGGYDNTLCDACQGDSAEIVRTLLNHGADVNIQGGRYGSALQAACAKGNAKLVQILLEHGADVSLHDRETRNTALQAACTGDNPEIVRLLLESSANNNFSDAADIVRILLDNATNLEPEAWRYSKLIEAALVVGNRKAARTLLGITPDYVVQWVSNTSEENADILELLTPFLTREHMTIEDQTFSATLLHHAVRLGSEAAARRCIELGSNVHAKDVYDETPLHYAAENGHLGMVKMLVDAGSSKDALNHIGWTPCKLAQDKVAETGGESHAAVVAFLHSTNSDISVLSTNQPRDSASPNNLPGCT